MVFSFAFDFLLYAELLATKLYNNVMLLTLGIIHVHNKNDSTDSRMHVSGLQCPGALLHVHVMFFLEQSASFSFQG